METKDNNEEKIDIKKEILSYVYMIALVVAAVLFLNEFFVVNAKIPSSSMENSPDPFVIFTMALILKNGYFKPSLL